MLPPLKYKLMLIGFLLPFMAVWPQLGDEDLHLIESSVVVNSSIDQAWRILGDFAGVGEFHVLYEESTALNEDKGQAYVGAQRKILMPNGNYNFILTESIIDLKEGAYYTYEVTDWENISLGFMKVTVGVRTDEMGATVLYSRTRFRMSNTILTSLYKARFSRISKDSLISYKYFMEKGVGEKDLRKLRKWYKDKEGDVEENAFLLSSLEP